MESCLRKVPWDIGALLYCRDHRLLRRGSCGSKVLHKRAIYRTFELTLVDQQFIVLESPYRGATPMIRALRRGFGTC